MIRTTTDCPLERLVTRAYDGIGKVGWAAVILYMSYSSPDEVRWPWNFLPYQLATPRWANCASAGSGLYVLPNTTYGRLAYFDSGSALTTASGTSRRLAGGCSPGPSSM